MEVRNSTGRTQVDSASGTVLPPMPLGEWTDLPYEVAMRFWRMRKADIRQPDQMQGHLWKESDGMHIFWMSPFSLADGYATAAENMVLALVRQGVHVHAAACWFASMYGLQMDTVKMLQTPHPAPMKVGICMATAGEFRKLPTPYKIGLTMYETDNPLENLPEWRHDCSVLDMLIVPSEHSKQIFGKFVKAPIKVVPLAVNPFYYQAKRKRVTSRPFTFGLHGTLTGRKAPLELMDAFKKAFPTEQDVRLQLKTRLGIMGFGQQTQITQPADRRIQIINQNWLHTRMRGWLTDTVDVYVFPSKGEGFGMPPREAMACGCPVMFTNHTGMVDFADERYNWPIPVAKEEESPLGGIWRIPDWDYVIETMRWMYHNRQAAYDKAHKGALWFIENHGADAAAKKLITILEQVEPDKPKKRRIRASETIARKSWEGHGTFYEQFQQRVPAGKVIDVGVGEGVLYAWLHQNGYEVTGIVEPGQKAKVARKLRKYNLPINIIEQPLWELDKLGLEADACVSQGILQDYRRHEIELVLRAMLRTSPEVWFSVPTVHYPNAFSKNARLRRRDRWQDMLEDFEYDMHYYGHKRRYIWTRVINIDQGMRATTVRQSEQRGTMIDDTWHPNPWERPDGKVVRGEPTV